MELSVILAGSFNNIWFINTWLTLEKYPVFKFYVFDQKKDLFHQDFLAIAHKIVGIKYSVDIVICGFKYYTISRTLCNRLRKDFQSPSLAILRRITSKVSQPYENIFWCVFNMLNASQKYCIIFYEVYKKNMLSYHGKQLCGK